MPVSDHRDDVVVCEDTGNHVERDDAHKDSNGKYWEDSDNLTCCPDCDGTFGVDEIDENDGHCETCRRDNYTECTACGDVIKREDRTTSECGDDYCHDCYCDRFYTCDDCGCEVHRDDVRGRNGSVYCESCCGPDEDEEYDAKPWRAKSAAYAKVGSQRKFGVELESSESDGWSDWIESTAFGAKNDGSVNGKEFVSPVLSGDDGLEAVENFITYANRNGVDVDDACGYHLHIDLSNEDSESRARIALAYAYTRDFWFACVDESRRDNSYCHSNVRDGRVHWDVDTIKVSASQPRPDTRYVWLNWNAYNSHRTVEVRLHEGTFSKNAVCNWIKAHLRFVDYVKTRTFGQITRQFGNKGPVAQLRNMRDIWKDEALSAYYDGTVRAGVREMADAA